MKCLLLHGLGQTPSSWRATMTARKSKSEHLCPDLFAFLQGKDSCYTNLYQAFAAYCGAFPEPFDLCGLSLGGILALQYAIEHPEKVHALALIGTQYVVPKTLLKFQNAISAFMPDRMFTDMGFQKKDFIRLSKSMTELDFRQGLEKITCPVLVLCGEKDTANKKAAIRLSQLLPNATLRLIPNAGHEVNIDQPQQLGQILDDFFTNI